MPEYTLRPTAFPENYGQFRDRVRAAFEGLLSQGKEGECLVIVTHGFAVRELCYDYGSLIFD